MDAIVVFKSYSGRAGSSGQQAAQRWLCGTALVSARPT